MALFGTVCGGALYWMGTLHESGGMAIQSAAVSFIIALVWSIQYAAVTGRLMVTRPSSVPFQEPPAEGIQERDAGSP
jgi:hypothetical protein